ncbi:hypothetical protein SEA_MAYA_39 [Streptomyces phage Maya]|uniref:Uncharacterized protein n=12 Tax=Rimavirus rima TaxID=2560784 RepID=A0A515MIQ5_9CAUD|nr:hypothetical protein FDH06_gp40 [Streptomyces phage Rima]AOZ64904.1 hypothetical protein SEA_OLYMPICHELADO_39 [Streptomyces phage OlympicHelado]ASU04034.1 hypothetical protein SEA_SPECTROPATRONM_39 [Streptomyces phage Spectropatronm]QAY16250.1 hypothetical protein SEA_ICEWARRIOR_38 [Streptomyces phage IceWarrior]QAY16338.1 hypothetical protein SEA_NAMO_40 [Streptomyces phage Namo]QDM56540.1 hypothetical protein SEA_ESKETIT_39 [Streptomyces phage Esketit]QEQ93732.1 hypothetical protein SEA_
MDNNTSTESQDINLGKEIAKAFAVGTAQSAASVVGLLVIGYAYSKYLDKKEAKKAKKNAKTEN